MIFILEDMDGFNNGWINLFKSGGLESDDNRRRLVPLGLSLALLITLLDDRGKWTGQKTESDSKPATSGTGSNKITSNKCVIISSLQT